MTGGILLDPPHRPPDRPNERHANPYVVGSSTVISGVDDGIEATPVLWTVINNGTIIATGTAGAGIDLEADAVNNYGRIGSAYRTIKMTEGGSVSNRQMGSMLGLISSAGDGGVDIDGSTGTLTNFGTITAAGGFALGVANFASNAMVTNYGTIQATGTNSRGVIMGGGALTNVGKMGTVGMITDDTGVENLGFGTVTISGTIAGAAVAGAAAEARSLMTRFRALFVGQDASFHENLWVTDGTAAGTSELAVAGASPGGIFALTVPDFTVLGGKALFQGVDVSGHTDLWVTDGARRERASWRLPRRGRAGSCT